jgi:uncharacterized membrane protein
MSEIKNNSAPGNLEAKRAAVLAGQSRGKKPYVALLLIAVAAVGLLGFWGLTFMPEEQKVPATGQMFGYVPKTGEVAYPLSDFKEGAILFYQHKAEGGVFVRYFVGVDGGEVTAALDACAECWRTSKGHRQEGAMLVCQSCSKSFALKELTTGTDPCTPLLLPHQVRDSKVVIAIPDLLAGAKYFRKIQGSKKI